MERLQLLKIACVAHQQDVVQCGETIGCKSQYLYAWAKGKPFSKRLEPVLMEYIKTGIEKVKNINL